MRFSSSSASSAILCVLSVAIIAPALIAAPKVQPPRLAYLDVEGRLAYDSDEQGNRVPDFSHCGYDGGDAAIPVAPVRVVVSPVAGDATERIQRAIDYVASLPPDGRGLRGAVLLLRGRHEIGGGLCISASGVVLRGQGMGEEGTTLVATGVDRRTLIRVVGQNDRQDGVHPSVAVVDGYVPVGARSLQLETSDHLKPGDLIRITRPSSQRWIDLLGATEFGGGVGGGWKPGTHDIAWDRRIQSIRGNQVSIDAPLTTALEKGLGGGSVTPFVWPGRIKNVGIENLRLECSFDAARPKDEDHAWCAVTLENAADAWVRQVTFRHFAGSAVAVLETAQRISVQACLSLAPVSEVGGYRRHTFSTMGQQTLFLRCYAEHGRHDFSVGHCAAGPNAFVQCEARNALADSGPIESWASGVLYDNVVIDGNALTLGYRPGNNAAIGWSAANCVLWNCSAAVIRCWNPPGARNWSFGSWASFEGDGIWRASNEFVEPDSLLAAQLRDRLGAEAAERLQLTFRRRGGYTNPSLEQAQVLAVASRQPAPQLHADIAAAGQRDPIPCDPGTALRVEEVPARASATPLPRSTFALTNGWITGNGKLLTGGIKGVTWWRGRHLPGEASKYGVGITRFVPGRVGPGLTDDLDAVANRLKAEGCVALDHNYGLWYDRRRDDHERTRRIDGDVLPPFLEQPFARSGQGTAWDGLSRYDLSRFNPWYWTRLRRFADGCDERGLVLFHQHYFQHNILEAGAHWTDFPWRSANNVNGTGFPEPPPYAGDKRIFMAELFYDVTHPVRRKLHEGYIRQCLDNFTNNVNVIQFTGAEFTGPLHFMQFWLDTVATWEQEKGCDALVALSCTQDVQDAILADARRHRAVDIIDFRYWWRTDKGEFAPPGGKNLAPRQFERRWRGGRPKDENLATMAAEYRARFPDKPLMCNFETAAWAWVCAGGSLPRLPRTTDTDLLAAIPSMRPCQASAEQGRWLLREPGKQILAYLGSNSELDLSGENGSFQMNVIDPSTGEATPGKRLTAGGLVSLTDVKVAWLRKE